LTTCAIIQPSYLPWLGLFELISKVDYFVHYDDVQFDKRGWRHRNLVKGPNGLEWLTIPVHLPSGSHGTLIRDAQIAKKDWGRTHLNLIRDRYKLAPFVDWAIEWLTPMLSGDYELITDVTIPLLEICSSKLKLKPNWVKSSTLNVVDERNLKLIKICKILGAQKYISGPSASSYLDVELFNEHGIEVNFFNYKKFSYPQLYGNFEAKVSVVDLFVMLGKNSYTLLSEDTDSPKK